MSFAQPSAPARVPLPVGAGSTTLAASTHSSASAAGGGGSSGVGAACADPTATQLSASCLDFLLIELVPLAYRIALDLARREDEWAGSARREADGNGAARGGDGSVKASAGGAGGALDEDEAREAVFYRLETLGYRVGLGVVER